MRNLKTVLAATAASMLSTAALAADLPIAVPPPPVPVQPCCASNDFGGWYLRGDVGFSNSTIKSLRNNDSSLYTPLTSFNETTQLDSAGIYDIGFGYQFNNWFRMDVTGQYRGSANFKGTDTFTGSAYGATYYGVDNYNASTSQWLVLANAYVDLGTWWCITPFVGAGVGTARVSMASFTDTGINTIPGSAYSVTSAANASRWNFAWALHAGLAYHVNPNVTLEVAYSYVNMGNGVTGATAAYDGSFVNGQPFTLHTITSNDVKVGLRWAINPTPAYVPPPPLITKG